MAAGAGLGLLRLVRNLRPLALTAFRLLALAGACLLASWSFARHGTSSELRVDDISAASRPRPQEQVRRLDEQIHMVHVGLVVAFFVLQTCCAPFYWWFCLRPTADLYVRGVMPDEKRGSWRFGLFECLGDIPACLKVTCCSWYAMAEMWYRSGFITGLMSQSEGSNAEVDKACPGWQFFIAWFGICCCSHGCGACMQTFYRHGGQEGSLAGRAEALREIYGLPQTPETACTDCLAECCCMPCAEVQDYRHAMLAAQLDAKLRVGAPMQEEEMSPAGKGPAGELVGSVKGYGA